MFWKTEKPMFSNKCVNRESITLMKDHNILSENLEVVETINVFISNIVKEMNISLGQELLTEGDQIEDTVLRIIKRFIKHTSMVAIFQNHKHNAFNFKHVSLDEVKRSRKLRCEEGFSAYGYCY